MFYRNSLAFSLIQQMLAIWSLVPLPFLNPAWTSAISQFTHCWSLAWRILTITLLARIFHDSSVGKEFACNARRPRFNSWIGKIPWRKDRLPTLVFLAFPCGSAGKESTCKVGDLGLIPGLGRSPGEGKGYPFQSMGLHRSQTQLSDFHILFFACMGNEHKCMAVWIFFDIALLWDWNWKPPFSSPLATAEFSKFAGTLSAAL